jgi:hypothetical protein
MGLSTNRTLVATAIACLLLYQVGTWIAAVAGGLWGAASALVVALVSFVSAKLARAGAASTGWFLVPTLLFTVIPLGARVWNALTRQTSAFDIVVDLTPMLVGFVIPVALLLLVYQDLRRRAGNGA